MQTVNSTELTKNTGWVIETALRDGRVAILRYGALVALLYSEIDGLDLDLDLATVTSTMLQTDTSAILDQCAQGEAFAVTRHGRVVAYLLPHTLRDTLGIITLS